MHPTRDVLTIYLKRCQCQLLIWMKASDTFPNSYFNRNFCLGIKKEKKRYRTSKRVPILMTTEIIPYACSELLKCGCKTMKCTFPCTCSRNRIQCLFACCCKAECSNTHNSATNLDDINDDDGDNVIYDNSVLFADTN